MSLTLLAMAESGLAAYKPQHKWLKLVSRRAAVAMILQLREGELGVWMIKRAEHEKDPWSGHMAFPGGRLEASDRNGLAAALRETEEETGLQLGAQEPCIGRLSDLNAVNRRLRGALVISPYVFHLKRSVSFRPNEEVDEMVWVPLEFLLDTNNREEMVWERGKISLKLPCYLYEERRIWGLSLRMLDELMDVVAGRSEQRPMWRRF